MPLLLRLYWVSNSGAGVTVSQQRFLCLTIVCAAGYLYVHACAVTALFLGLPYVCVPVGVFWVSALESVQLSALLVHLPSF